MTGRSGGRELTENIWREGERTTGDSLKAGTQGLCVLKEAM